jgi:hypothetical protein
MKTFTISAATMTVLAALLASAPARAERNWGPLKNGDQCWKEQVNTGGFNAGTWGYWTACPAAASVAVEPRHHHHHHTASR